MSSPVEEIKERLDIATVVSSYVKLQKAGSYLKARCPFHNEKTPSFIVSPGRGTFHCFGCGAGGDIFTFVQEFEGIEFKEALRILGERAGVDIQGERPETRKARDRQYEIMRAAATFFVETLAKAPQVTKYLTDERGLTQATIETWQVGYAPDEWRGLYDHLTSLGYEAPELEELGLIKRPDSASSERYYDRFRGRIIFPIADRAGHTVAFSGRLFTSDEGEAPEGAPKYLNSPETPLFHKSHILHGFDKAKQSIRKLNCSIVVEGQLDLLASYQAGFGNSVAPSGTALTREQLEMLAQLSGNVILAFDSDEAGLAAAAKSARLALSLGMDTKLVALPEGVDPADLVKKDPKKWKEAVRAARHPVDFFLDKLRAAGYDDRTFRLRAQESVFPFVRLITNKIDQAHFVGKLSGELSVPEEAVWEELRKAPADEEAPRARPVTQSTSGAQRTREALSFTDTLYRLLLDMLVIAQHDTSFGIDEAALRHELGRLRVEYPEHFPVEPETAPTAEDATFRVEAQFEGVEDWTGEARALTQRLESELAKTALGDAMRSLRAAEESGDEKAVSEALAACKALSDKVARLGGET